MSRNRDHVIGAEARYEALLDEIRAEFPRFLVIDKRDSLLQRSIQHALTVVTLGGQRRYLEGYVTTLGARVYVPSTWAARAAADRYITMRHERVHLRQFRRWSFPLMALLYLLLPLPFGLAWCRYRFERAAYEESLRAAAEVYGPAVLCDAAFRDGILAQFTSGAYGWMWPFPGALARWYERTALALGAPPTLAR
ncbi:MAG: hypothetical protein EXR72_02150 [Myxococcales bacterium]|nr:hypothetical protein [Myxococcales bacterium]